ncbi:MAG: zinc finger domain-containing protein [Sulfolobales archaeon]
MEKLQRLATPVIIDSSTPPICTSCKRFVTPYEKGVSFPCPNCGKTVIWRCYRCRAQGIPYKCPNCWFEGP